MGRDWKSRRPGERLLQWSQQFVLGATEKTEAVVIGKGRAGVQCGWQWGATEGLSDLR